MPARGMWPQLGSAEASADDMVGRPDVLDQSGTVAAIVNDYFWDVTPPPVIIPYAWLSPPARFRADQPINDAQISQGGGGAARSTNGASIAQYGDTAATATLNTTTDADIDNLAEWLTTFYAGFRMRMPALTINLLDTNRTTADLWRILGVKIGDRLLIPDTPGQPQVLNTNTDFETDVSGWLSSNGAVLSWSQAQAYRGVSSLLITPPGAVVNCGASTTLIPYGGGPASISAWVFSPTGWSDVRPVIDWFDAAGVFIASGLPTATSVPANLWTPISTTQSPPARAAQVMGRVRIGATPGVTNVLHVDRAPLAGVPAGEQPWPEGTPTLIVEGISRRRGVDLDMLTLNTSPVIGSTPGAPGPWFRLGSSVWGGPDLVPF